MKYLRYLLVPPVLVVYGSVVGSFAVAVLNRDVWLAVGAAVFCTMLYVAYAAVDTLLMLLLLLYRRNARKGIAQ